MLGILLLYGILIFGFYSIIDFFVVAVIGSRINKIKESVNKLYPDSFVVEKETWWPKNYKTPWEFDMQLWGRPANKAHIGEKWEIIKSTVFENDNIAVDKIEDPSVKKELLSLKKLYSSRHIYQIICVVLFIAVIGFFYTR